MNNKIDEEKIKLLKDKLKLKKLAKIEEVEEISIDKIADNFKKLKTRDEIYNYLDELHDVDIALTLDELDSDVEVLRILNVLDEEEKAAVLEECDEELQKRIIGMLPEDEVLEIFTYMSPDDITDILGFIHIDKRKSLLDNMKRSDANKIRELLGYSPDSAGGIMTTRYLAFKKNITIKDVFEKIKIIGPKTEYIETIFVLDIDGTLIGEVDLRDILSSNSNLLLEKIMEENVKFVYLDEDQEQVAKMVSKYSLSVVPVVNKNMKLLGIITIDDVVDVIQEENTEDILKMGGAGDDETLSTDLYSIIRKRLPWLLVNLISAFLASFTVDMFSSTISKVVALASIMPIVSGMGGNAGTQSLAVTIRAIALDEDDEAAFVVILKYLLTGLINGTIIGTTCGAIVYIMFGNIYISLIILMSMIGNYIIACLVGYLIPKILKAINIDPAMASSIILTAITDICGFFLFLGLASVFIDKLV